LGKSKRWAFVSQLFAGNKPNPVSKHTHLMPTRHLYKQPVRAMSLLLTWRLKPGKSI
jgi:hypothetical protein